MAPDPDRDCKSSCVPIIVTASSSLLAHALALKKMSAKLIQISFFMDRMIMILISIASANDNRSHGLLSYNLKLYLIFNILPSRL